MLTKPEKDRIRKAAKLIMVQTPEASLELMKEGFEKMLGQGLQKKELEEAFEIITEEYHRSMN